MERAGRTYLEAYVMLNHQSARTTNELSELFFMVVYVYRRIPELAWVLTPKFHVLWKHWVLNRWASVPTLSSRHDYCEKIRHSVISWWTTWRNSVSNLQISLGSDLWILKMTSLIFNYAAPHLRIESKICAYVCRWRLHECAQTLEQTEGAATQTWGPSGFRFEISTHATAQHAMADSRVESLPIVQTMITIYRDMKGIENSQYAWSCVNAREMAWSRNDVV